MKIPLSAPDITEAEIDAVVAVLRTPRLSLGPVTEQFESAVAEVCLRAPCSGGQLRNGRPASLHPRVGHRRRRRGNRSLVHFYRSSERDSL